MPGRLRRLSRSTASVAQSVELNHVIRYVKVVLLGQSLLGSIEQLDLLVDEVRVVDYPAAPRAHKMMVVARARWIFGQLEPCPAVAEVEFEDEPRMNE